MTKKLAAMQESPELFKKFQEVVERSQRLMATVNLCDEKIELVLFATDKSGIDSLTTFNGYDEGTFKALTNMMDTRATGLKGKWVSQYAKLAESDIKGVSIDLSHMDYAEIIVGNDATNEHYYRMNWSFDDLLETAEFISNHCNPSPAVLERFQKHQVQ